MPPKIRTPGYSSNIKLYGEAESAGLTPRTPYSHDATSAHEAQGRSQRSLPAIPVNEANTEDEDDGNHDEVDLLQTQSHPLLHSSASESFLSASGRDRRRWSGDKKSHSVWRTVEEILARDRLPIGLIVGSGAAFLLLFLIVLAVGQPQTLLNYMGVNSTAIAYESLDDESKARFNTSTVIDYAASGYTSFPLTTDQYVSECWNVTNDPRMKAYESYWIAAPGTEFDVLHKKPTSNTCTSSITYLLDGSVGLMGDLAILAQVAMFSRERNRTLFLNDDHWNRGRWTDHFLPFSETQPGPEPGCAPPPPEELVACPRTARHWVISARIGYFHLGDHFEEEYEDAYKYTIERKKPVFDRTSQSFTEFIQPNAVNQGLIQRARDELALLDVPTNLSHSADIEYISTHIRWGDREAMSWRYQKMPNAHIPVTEYVSAVWNAYTLLQNLSGSDLSIASPPFVYLASDSSSAASEFRELLVTNESLVQKYGNENLKPIVYNLRTSADAELRGLAPAVEYVQAAWNNRTEEDRIRETRGVIVDWALLSGAWSPKPGDGSAGVQVIKPAATICTLPSNLCKLAAVGLGWNRSFDFNGMNVGPHQRWIEIDNNGGISPIWKAFEIFS